MPDKIKWDDLHPDDRGSIVRHNMLNDVNYRPYCGNELPRNTRDGCSNPRTIWDKEFNQMRCPHCDWISQFPADFIVRYKDIHGLE